jgi:hypothetical protein
MGIFRKKHRESATPLEDVAEDDAATPGHGFRGAPNLTGAGLNAAFDGAAEMERNPESDPLSRKRHRAEANLEDDYAETQLINEERPREEY